MKLVTNLLLVGLLVLQGCSTLVAIPKPASEPQTRMDEVSAIAQWNDVLRTYVNPRGEVDFAALAKWPEQLLGFLAYVQKTPLDEFTAGDQKLAHFINSYNALSMFNVIDSGIPLSNQALSARYKFFIARKFTIGGQTMSLYSFENDIIRKLGEPRIHWALNCSALSCPVLPMQAFIAQGLDQQLDSEAKKFFANPANLRINHPLKEVWLSEILSFFTEDFVPKHAPSLIAYVNRYALEAVPEGYAVKFSPYDWTIANSVKTSP